MLAELSVIDDVIAPNQGRNVVIYYSSPCETVHLCNFDLTTVSLVLIQSVPKLHVWLPLDYMFCSRNCLLDHVGLLTLAVANTEISVRIVTRR